VVEVTNEVRSRARNERIGVADATKGVPRRIDTYVCDYSYRTCTSVLGLTRDEYEGVRAEPTHFAIALNHENPEVDRVVSENERLAVVEKFLEMRRRVARETDPRR
jgi:hypothetical protein